MGDLINLLRINSDTDMYITGPNFKLLIGEFATKILGRYIQIQVHLFFFLEYCMVVCEKEQDISKAELFYVYKTKRNAVPYKCAE